MSEHRPMETSDARGLRAAQNLLVEPWLRSAPPTTATLAERMAHYCVPGLGLAVIEAGRVVWEIGHGVREAGQPAPVLPETRFQAASISKPVTALAALRLVERGDLTLDGDVNAGLRSWKIPANGSWQPRVTLRELLCHSAGLTVHRLPGYPPGQPLPTLRQLLDGEPPANSPPVRVDVLPGTICRYSGGGYCVLQQLLCDVTGADFATLMRELVLEPLGMAHSSFVQPLLPSWADAAAIGHGWMTRVPVAGGRHSYPEQAAAGLWTTAGDLARFAIGVQAAYAGAAGALLSAELAREMLTPQLGDEHAGLGLWLSGNGEGRRFGHSGSNEGFICELIAFAQGGCGAAVMTNGQAGSALVAELMRAIAVEYRWPGYLPERRQPVAADPLALAACGGVYEARPGVRITVTPSNGGLALSFAGQAALALLPAADGSFFAEALNCEASFRREGQAPAHELMITQAGRETLARRVVE